MTTYLDRAEAAAFLKVSTVTIDRLRRSGELASKKLGRRVLIPMTEIEELLESLPEEER